MLEINFHPFKNLETSRLFLRRITTNDVAEIRALRSNPETMKFIPRPLVTNDEEALAHINLLDENIEKNLGINWAITLKGNPKLIGIISHHRIEPHNYRSEIRYMLLPEYNGKGIVTEAIKVVLDYGFNDLKLHSIEAIIDPKNVASERVLQKNGFVKEVHLIENEYYNGAFLDTIIYSLLKRNFNN